MNIFQKIGKFISEVKLEMSKVSWPSYAELRGSTWVVIILSLGFAAYIFTIDQFLTWLLKLVY